MRDSNRHVFRDYGITILIALSAAFFIRSFVLEAFRIPNTAMRPTLEPGDTIFVKKWGFGLRLPGLNEPVRKGEPPQRGDVVVFSFPDESRRDYLKRVVALPGETVQLRKGRLSINGKPVEVALERNAVCGTEKLPGIEKPHAACWEPPLLEDFGPEKIPADSVFVIGDSRSQSLPENRPPRTSDAPEGPSLRTWGVVANSQIEGKAAWIWLSIEPPQLDAPSRWLPRFRFDRMFRRID